MGKASKILLGLGFVTTLAAWAYNVISRAEPEKYSYDGIARMSETERAIEREIVRRRMCDPQYDTAAKIEYHRILGLFNKVADDLRPANAASQGPAYHREHGFNLYKP